MLLDGLFALHFNDVLNDDGTPEPVALPLTSKAKQLWAAFYNRHNQELAELTGELAAAWSKLEAYAARLALVVHCIRRVAGDPTLEARGDDDEQEMVDAGSVRAGVGLCDWFKHEIRRIYAQLVETDAERRQRELVEWIERNGGRVTVREVMRGPRPYRGDREAADRDLERLVEAGLGEWFGTPSRKEVLKNTNGSALPDVADAQHPAGPPATPVTIQGGSHHDRDER